MKCIESRKCFINKIAVPACGRQTEGASTCFLSHTFFVQGRCLPRVMGRDRGKPLTLDLACSLGPNPCDFLQCQLPLGILWEGKNWPHPLILGGM